MFTLQVLTECRSRSTFVESTAQRSLSESSEGVPVTTTDSGPRTVRPAGGRAVRKGLALLVLGMSQLMIVLDISIVNVALPDIARALRVQGAEDLSWVVTGYTLTFGGFLLLGGKLADRLGRRRIFIAGASLFAAASLLGGLAGNLGMLVAARLVQGLGGALMAPAALSMLTVVFAEGRERNRALGVWAAISAGGAAIGLIVGDRQSTR